MKALVDKVKPFALVFLVGSVLSLAGCGDSAEELYETARFEELQNNQAHARKLYEQILREHGGSPYAARARERLVGMSRGGG